MQKDLKSRSARIEEILKAAHRGRGLPPVRDSFSSGVMREIRGIGTERAGNALLWLRNGEARTVWRFAAAAALLTMIVYGYFLGSDPSGINYELAELAAGDSTAMILAHSLALI